MYHILRIGREEGKTVRMTDSHISLSEALKTGRLQDFIDQQEAGVVGHANKKEFDGLVKRAATQPQSPDQTSGSRAPGGLTGKKTR